MRRFAFFDRDSVRSPALQTLDITTASSGRGLIAAGDSEGHLVFVDRDFGCTAIQAHKTRVNAVAQVKGADVLVSIGDGADWRPSHVRASARATAIAARDRLRRERDRERAAASGKPKRKASDAGSDDNQDDIDGDDRNSNDGDNDAGSDNADGSDDDGAGRRGGASAGRAGKDGAEADKDLGYVLGLGVPLEGAASALVRGDAAWEAGSSIGPAGTPEASQPSAALKVWRLDKRDARTGAPECVRTMKIFTAGANGKDKGTNLAERVVTSLAVSEDLQQVAIGCGDGCILLLRGDLLRGGGRGGDKGSGGGLTFGISMSLGSSLKPQLLQETEIASATAGGIVTSSSAAAAAADGSGTPTSSASAVPGMTEAAVTFLAFTSQADPNAGTVAAVAGSGGKGSKSKGGDKASNAAVASAYDGGDDGKTASADQQESAFDSANPTAASSSSGKGGKGGASAAAAASRRSRPMVVLFACTSLHIRSYFTTDVRPVGMGRGWSRGEYWIDLDDLGCSPGCATVTDQGELAIGNDQGVFFYSHEERRAAYVFPGRKQRLGWFRGYLLLAAEDSSSAAYRAGAAGQRPGMRGVGGGMVPLPPAPTTLTIYDLRSKYIAYSMSLGIGQQQQQGGQAQLQGGRSMMPMPTASASVTAASVRYIMCEWGTVFLLVGSGASSSSASGQDTPSAGGSGSAASGQPLSIWQLTEKDTGTKVEHLCRLHLFDIAASIATAAHYGSDNLADIHKMHGDHLYSKGDYDGAVSCYMRTIGAVEPSYVIRKFLDTTRIGNLTSYLEALHSSGAATADHTTLLLNCYTKTRDNDKLRSFIRGEGSAARGGQHAAASSSGKAAADAPGSSAASSSTLTFDVRTAIAVLRDAGCGDEALYLAEQQGEHDLVLAILAEDSGLIEPEGDAGAAAASTAPGDASGQAPSTESVVVTAKSAAATAALARGALAAIAYIRRLPFVEAEFYCRKYGRTLLASSPSAATALLIMLCTKWVQDKPYLQSSIAPSSSDDSGSLLGNKRARVRVDSPDVFLPIFADAPLWLKQFCEALIAKAATNEVPRPSQAMWHTYLQVCLRRGTYDEHVRAQAAAEGGAESSASSTPSPAAAVPEPPSASSSAALPPAVAAGAPPAATGAADQGWDAYRDELVLTSILRNLSADYDVPTALALCSAAGYRAGVLYLYERMRMYPLVLNSLMDAAEASRLAGRHAEAKAGRRELVRKTKQFTESSGGGGAGAGASAAGGDGGGDGAGGLWIGVLRYLVRSYLSPTGQCLVPSPPDAATGRRTGMVTVSYPGLSSSSPSVAPSHLLIREREEQDSLLTDVLRHIDRSGALQPLAVLSVLAECPHLPFGLARDFIVRRLATNADRAAEDRRVVESLRADTVAMEGEIARLDNQPVLFQSRVCRLCGLELDLPSVHFLCGGLLGPGGAGEEHSFHQHCVTDAMAAQLGGGAVSSSSGGGGGGDGSDGSYHLECPICAPSQRQVRDIRSSLGAGLASGGGKGGGGLSEQFFSEMSAASDGFGKAAEYLSKGIFAT